MVWRPAQTQEFVAVRLCDETMEGSPPQPVERRRDALSSPKQDGWSCLGLMDRESGVGSLRSVHPSSSCRFGPA